MDCCAICQDELGTARVTTSCNHAYHLRCLSEWYAKQEKGSCPLCRKEAAEMDGLARPAVVADDEDYEDEINAYLQAQNPSNSGVFVAFLDSGQWVRDCDPPYTLAKVKDNLEAWIEGEEEEGRTEETQWRAYKLAIDGLERWRQVANATN